LNQLEAEGLIHRQIGGGAHSNTYYLIEPTPPPSPARRTAVRHV